MIVEIHKIGRLAFEKVHYYTVLVKGRERFEYMDFLTRMSSNANYKNQLGKIQQFITEIGTKHGAHPAHFKHERHAEALPPPYFIQSGDVNKYGLRLYCIRLSTNVVLLLNGDLKTNDNPEKCPNCKAHFALANKISKKINDAILSKQLWLNGIEIQWDDDFELEIN